MLCLWVEGKGTYSGFTVSEKVISSADDNECLYWI